MNRKERRAGAKLGKSATPFASAQGQSPAALTANLFASAMQHFRAGQIDAAERLCRDALVFDRNHYDSLHLLGIIAWNPGRAIAANARSPECHFNLGLVLRMVGRLDEAAACLTQATVLKRDDAAANLGLADVLAAQGKLDEARSRYERALVLDPRLADAYHGLAYVLMQQGHLDQSVAHYRRTLALK